MSVDRWLCLLTEEQINDLTEKAANWHGEDWFHICPSHCCFDFGDARDGNSVRYAVQSLRGVSAIEKLDSLKLVHDNTTSMIKWEIIRDYVFNNPNVNCYFYEE